MSRKFLVNLDLALNQLLNVVIQNLASDPGSPAEGQVWYNTTTHLLKWRNNSATIDPLARANHSGTQTASTVSDFDTQVRTSRLDQMASPTANVSMNSNKVTNLATPTSATDACTKAYVDAAVNGLDWKASCRAATTANLSVTASGTGVGKTLTATGNGAISIDSVSLALNDRVLVKNQTTQANNGIYTVTTVGTGSTPYVLTRATDADENAEVTASLSVFVSEGTTNADTQWQLTTNDSITVDTTALAFQQIGSGTSYTNGTGISISGNVISATGPQKYTATIGDGSSTSITLTDGLGTIDKVAIVRDASTGAQVECDITYSSTQTTFAFATAPASNAYKVVVIG